MTRCPLLDWTDDGPRSQRFGDVYFSAADGLAESRAVFLAGCGLPDAWASRRRFTVAELGFGTGLNILALLALWRETRPRGGRLQIFSIEGFALSADEARRAHGAWPELSDLAAELVRQWPSARPGFHRLDFPELGATLDVGVGEVGPMLEAWQGRADAWFLDGFAPAKNPDMWSEAVLRLVAERSAPGARVATFTVAGAVRRGLEALGFAVAKRPGFGRKKERLEAQFVGAAVEARPPPRVAIVGAGIAGAALARAFRALGAEPTVLEADAPGAGASGNPAALVAPRLDAGGGAVATLHAQAFDRAVALYPDEAVLARGALQLEAGPRDTGRFDRIAGWEGFTPGAVVRRSREAVAQALGEPVGPGGLEIAEALTIEPQRVLERWLGPVVLARVERLERSGGAWRLIRGDGSSVLEAEVVCLCAGIGARALARLGPMRAVRGQVSVAAIDGGPPAAWGGYAIPTAGGVLFGATHDRDVEALAVRAEDHARNLALLAKARPRLAAAIEEAPLAGRAGIRAAMPDHLPLAGELEPGLFVLGGLGGRGFTLAPLLAEEVAAMAMDAARPLPRGLAALVDPRRYRDRSNGPS
jgi:tRNA 5-methylaminomethyl-2-thiouridine biosynthesis bifunctional protein